MQDMDCLRAEDVPAPRSGLTVLVVDKYDGVRRMAARLLRALGYDSLEAENEHTALALVEEQQVDLLLSGMTLRASSGIELARDACALKPHLKTIIMSGEAGLILEDQDHLKPDAVLLRKPFTKADIELALRRALDNKED